MVARVPGIDRLKELNCIKKMGEDYLSIWTELVHKYGNRLNQDIILKKVAFTNHDFTHHCKNIYVIIENVLLNNVELTEEEYFVLAVAVLLHDISMTKENFQRLCHSKQSADYIQNEIDTGVDEWKSVPTQHVPAIKEIVKAHSDIKVICGDGHEKVEHRTLAETPVKLNGEYNKDIHVRWLAGVLRIADELDVTNARLGTAETRYKNLNSFDEGEGISKQRWEQLNYFSNVKRYKTNIVLELNDTYLKANVNDDRYNICKQIKSVRQTICKKLTEVNELAFDADEEYYNYIKLRDVRFEDKQKIFQEWELDDDLGKENKLPEVAEPVIAIKDLGRLEENATDASEGAIEKEEDNFEHLDCVLDKACQLRDSLSKKIANYIYDNELICYGHYRLNRLFCGKDWINVRKILSDPILGQECIDVITTDLEMIMEKKNIDNVLAIGVSINGNIMASRVAFRLGLPFTYIVPQKPGMVGSEMEKAYMVGNSSKVVLFTGVISSMDTLKTIINGELKDVDIFRIYTVLMRRPSEKKSDEDLLDIKNKIRYLNADFLCEVVPKTQCMSLIYGKCIARNRQAYNEVFEWPLAVKAPEENRIFINNVIGCNAACEYCYLSEIGIHKRHMYTFEEVKAEFERLYDVDPSRNIISIGCYAESMMEENSKCMSQLVQYFAEKGYYIQISTKKKISEEWLTNIEGVLQFENQLNIYVSIPTISRAKEVEPGADSVTDRISNFLYQSPSKKIKMYLYIKPYLDEITEQDKEKYLEIIEKYNLDVIVGAKFQSECGDSECVSVGINSMYETVSTQKDAFMSELKSKARVYKHSTEPIKMYLK